MCPKQSGHETTEASIMAVSPRFRSEVRCVQCRRMGGLLGNICGRRATDQLRVLVWRRRLERRDGEVRRGAD